MAVAGVLAPHIIRAVADHRKKNKRTTRGEDALVGKECKISTLLVNSAFGQAVVEDGGPGLIISVRCAEPNPLQKGDAARIVAFHPGGDTYEIEPMIPWD